MAEQTKHQQLELHLAARALEDPEFRVRLLEDPKRTIEREIGLQFPATVRIRVHEEKLNELHVVLPIEIETIDERSLRLVRRYEEHPLPFWKRMRGRKYS